VSGYREEHEQAPASVEVLCCSVLLLRLPHWEFGHKQGRMRGNSAVRVHSALCGPTMNQHEELCLWSVWSRRVWLWAVTRYVVT